LRNKKGIPFFFYWRGVGYDSDTSQCDGIRWKQARWTILFLQRALYVSSPECLCLFTGSLLCDGSSEFWASGQWQMTPYTATFIFHWGYC
jgi:hypothetical protein